MNPPKKGLVQEAQCRFTSPSRRQEVVHPTALVRAVDRALPNSDSVYWRLQHFGHRAAHSLLKRVAFPAYARLGRDEDWNSRLCKIRRVKVALREALQLPLARSR